MTSIAPDLADRILAADRHLSGGKLAEARSILEDAARLDPPTPDFWQRLATVRKLAGAPLLALEAIDRALALAPLDFVNLMMRAHLLDGAGHPEAGEAYGRALAQPRPDPLPPMLQRTIAPIHGPAVPWSDFEKFMATSQ